MNSLKENLYQQCMQYVLKRIAVAEEGIRDAQQAQNDDTKSSAGDKYETGREMAQQETNRYLVQLDEANKLKVALNTIGHGITEIASPGSVVYTNNGNFYLSISAGQLMAEGKSFYAVSPASPIGMQLMNKKAGEQIAVNGKTYEILAVE